MYFVTAGSSQQTPHGSSVRAIHGVTSVSSNSDWCITDTPWPTCKNNTCGVPYEFKFWLISDKISLLNCFRPYITPGSSQQTPHGSPARAMHGVPPVSSISYLCTTSLQDPHNRHPMARPQGQHILWVQILIDTLYHYRILPADTPRIVREDNTWGVLCEYKFWLIYHITTGSSQQTHHGLPAKAIHVSAPVSSNPG